MAETEQKSPVITLIDLVWEHTNVAIGRSNLRRQTALKDALRLAISAGMPFAKDDCTKLATRHGVRYTSWCPWGADAESQVYAYAVSCGNEQAARSWETLQKRRPFTSKSIVGNRSQGRLAVGNKFDFQEETFTVTSFAESGAYLVACTYHPQPRGTYAPLKIAKRLRITHEMLRANLGCKHEWLEKSDYNEKWCPKCHTVEMLVTRKEILAMPMEQRREILAKQSAAFVEDHPDYFEGLLED
ncbi:hypothetical protein LCGC14_1334460 [marine sediment metagenome]|uniref:Uncharacterized protein n=1 Tax=marine sediment metagenome TaxID=412755 RepID=A0A0F9L1L9_9ZZZZ